MHRFSVCVAVAVCGIGSCWVPASSIRAANPPAEPAPIDARAFLRQGLFEEEANRDLGRAAADYASVIEHYDAGRTVAATAIFRLAEIRNKQGNKAEATALYQRVLVEFPGDDALTRPSRERLAALGVPVPDAHCRGFHQPELPPTRPPPPSPPRSPRTWCACASLVKNSPDLLNSVARIGPLAPTYGYTPLAYAADRKAGRRSRRIPARPRGQGQRPDRRRRAAPPRRRQRPQEPSWSNSCSPWVRRSTPPPRWLDRPARRLLPPHGDYPPAARQRRQSKRGVFRTNRTRALRRSARCLPGLGTRAPGPPRSETVPPTPAGTPLTSLPWNLPMKDTPLLISCCSTTATTGCCYAEFAQHHGVRGILAA